LFSLKKCVKLLFPETLFCDISMSGVNVKLVSLNKSWLPPLKKLEKRDREFTIKVRLLGRFSFGSLTLRQFWSKFSFFTKAAKHMLLTDYDRPRKHDLLLGWLRLKVDRELSGIKLSDKFIPNLAWLNLRCGLTSFVFLSLKSLNFSVSFYAIDPRNLLSVLSGEFLVEFLLKLSVELFDENPGDGVLYLHIDCTL
jgi:hypothetical protein